MLAASSRSAAFRVELNPHVAAALIGPRAERLRAIEETPPALHRAEGRRAAEHFEVVARGPLAKLQPESPVEEGQELTVKPVEVGLHDPASASRSTTASTSLSPTTLVGKRAKVRITRVLDGTAYAELADGQATDPPITAEAMAEKPTCVGAGSRGPRSRRPRRSRRSRRLRPSRRA